MLYNIYNYKYILTYFSIVRKFALQDPFDVFSFISSHLQKVKPFDSGTLHDTMRDDIYIIYSFIMDFLWSLFAFILVLSPLVFIHELGHYLAARANGVKVDSFSIGFGPQLIGWTDRQGTQWKISLLLFGGYVKMAGDDNVASSAFSKCAATKSGTLASKKPWQRVVIALAGPFSNYLLAVTILLPLMLTIGKPRYMSIVEQVMPHSLSKTMGVKPDQVIFKVNEKPAVYADDFMRILQQTSVDIPLKIVIFPSRTSEKNAKKQDSLGIEQAEAESPTQTIVFQKDQLPSAKRHGHWMGKLGIQFSNKHPKYEVLSFEKALKNIGHTMNPLAMFKSIKLDNMGGPVGIAQQAGHFLKDGWVAFLYFSAMISIALGFFNLLPIPLLDGGMVLFAVIEMITRKPLSERVQQVISLIAFVFLGSFFLLTFWNDFQKIHPVYEIMKKVGIAK